MPITFVDNPIEDRCHVGLGFMQCRLQCHLPNEHTMTDGFKRVEVCCFHRNNLLRNNEFWKTQWRDLESDPPDPSIIRTELSAAEMDSDMVVVDPTTAAYRVQPYSINDNGYSIHFFYPLDSGLGEGSYRVATFVAELEAGHFATYCNHQLEKYNTNEMAKWI